MNTSRECVHGRRIGHCGSCDVVESENRIAELDRQLNEKMSQIRHLDQIIMQIQRDRDAEVDALTAQLVAVKAGGGTGQSPCAKFCESVALQKDFEEMRNKNVQLKKERDAFAAKVGHLAGHIENVVQAEKNNTGYEPSISVFHRAIDEAKNAIGLDELQILRDIRAVAIENAAQRVLDNVKLPRDTPAVVDYYKVGVRSCAAMLIQYAAKVRQGGES